MFYIISIVYNSKVGVLTAFCYNAHLFKGSMKRLFPNTLILVVV